MENIINQIKRELNENANEKIRIGGQRYFKEEVRLYGLKSAHVNQISRNHLQKIKGQGKKQVFDFCEKLFHSGYLEEAIIACNWSYYFKKEYIPDDFSNFEKWVKQYINNWAACDTLCNHTIGSFIVMYPEFLKNLKEWANSPNRWVKRAAAVSLIVPARNGKFLSEIREISDILLSDKDDMVQKGYGWMLKAASQAHQKEIFTYVVKNKALMPRTALRYAIEKMPEDLKRIAMAK
jgi:3-methyladenine DNA glycosylase AlkD